MTDAVSVIAALDQLEAAARNLRQRVGDVLQGMDYAEHLYKLYIGTPPVRQSEKRRRYSEWIAAETHRSLHLPYWPAYSTPEDRAYWKANR